VGGALYLHASALDDETRPAVERAVALANGFEWNVAKVSPGSVSLLLYEDFDAAGFPALLASLKVDLETGKSAATDYRKRENPPILHRKETLLPVDDPRRPKFAALTRAAAARVASSNAPVRTAPGRMVACHGCDCNGC
jgi:hypothetical protein